MALLNTDGAVIETEEDWLTFFQETLKFPVDKSVQYSKQLSAECFTSDTLVECIEDSDMHTVLKMPWGHFKKLKMLS